MNYEHESQQQSSQRLLVATTSSLHGIRHKVMAKDATHEAAAASFFSMIQQKTVEGKG
jgi:hypothetical protein